MPTALVAPATTIDLRRIPPRERHDLFLARFDAVRIGKSGAASTSVAGDSCCCGGACCG